MQRDIRFIRVRVDSYKVLETTWRAGKVTESHTRFMTPEQVGKRETELIREGFTLYSPRDDLHMRCYVKHNCEGW